MTDVVLTGVTERSSGQPAAEVPAPREASAVAPEPSLPAAAFESLVRAGHARDAGRIIAVISPKGGQGKTTIASNLAVGLARGAPGGVVLIDADSQFGDIEAVFALSPAHTLPDMVAGSATRDSLVLKALLTPHSSGIFVVCAAASPADGDEVTGEQLGDLISHLASIFPYVVIDTTPGLGEHALTAIELSTDTIVVSGPSVPTLLAVRKELEVLKTINLTPRSLHFVLNLADSAVGLDQRGVTALAGAPVSVVIPRSSVVALATNRGAPILLEESRDRAAKALGQLVAKVSGLPYSVRTRTARKRRRK